MSTFEAPSSEAAHRDLLAISKEKSGGGKLVGRDPRNVPLQILSLYHSEKNPLRVLSSTVSGLLLWCCERDSGRLPKLAVPDGHQSISQEARDI